MLISRLELTRFRNYKHLVIEPGPGLTVLVGPNAAGKTNAIEAVQILTSGRSFRNPRWSDVVSWTAQDALLQLTTEKEGVSTFKDITIMGDGSRTYRVNGITKRRFLDTGSALPSVIFTPDDLSLAKGPADNRRTAIDALGEQLSKTYSSIKRDYLRTVRQRNAALRDKSPHAATLSSLDDQLVTLGSSLCAHRRRLLQRASVLMTPIYKDLAGDEALTVRYESQVTGEISLTTELTVEQTSDLFRDVLETRRADEIVRQTTLVGPHRDDIIFEIDGRDARAFASQGQQRTIALAWKWMEVMLIEDIARKTPILLLDDVMSELDSARRATLTGLIQKSNQTFVTTTNIGYFESDLLAGAHIVEIPKV